MDYSSYRDRTLVIKISGKVVGDTDALRLTLNQVIALKLAGCHVILIHGGGDQIDAALTGQRIAYHKIDGIRFTSDEALPVVQRCLAQLNVAIVEMFAEEAGKQGVSVKAIGADRLEASMIVAERKFAGSRTGQIAQINADKLRELLRADSVPILHSVCSGCDGYFNVNADDLAMPLAECLGADRLLFCSNTCIKDKSGAPIFRLSDVEIERLIADGTIYNGAVVKVLACKAAVLKGGVGEVIILNGRDGSLVRALANDCTAGTRIFRSAEADSPLSLADACASGSHVACP